MKDIEVWDRVDMKSIVAVLPPRAAASVWDIVDMIDRDGQAYFDMDGASTELFARLANSGRRIGGDAFLRAAQMTPQVVWGTFRAFEDEGAETPWLCLDAVDSTFWRVRTADLPTRQAMLKAFRQVKQTHWPDECT